MVVDTAAAVVVVADDDAVAVVDNSAAAVVVVVAVDGVDVASSSYVVDVPFDVVAEDSKEHH
jgi:hypothetical protein